VNLYSTRPALPKCVTRVVLGIASAEQVRSISIGGPGMALTL